MTKVDVVRRPRVQVLAGSWRPQIRFYDSRPTILQALDDAKLLLRFRMPDDRVQALVSGVGSLDVGPGHIRLEVGSPVYDDNALAETLDIALSRTLQADSRWRVRCAFVIPTAGTYDEARDRALAKWVQAPINATATDAALLIDGVDEIHGWEYQVEFGVIEPAEAASRLHGVAGRTSGDLAMSSVDVETHGLPHMATFLDWNWTVPQAERKLVDAAAHVQAECCSRAASLSDAIHEMYSENPANSIGKPTRKAE